MFYHWSYGVEGFVWLFVGVFWLYGFLCAIDMPAAQERKMTEQHLGEDGKKPKMSYLEQYKKDHNL